MGEDLNKFFQNAVNVRQQAGQKIISGSIPSNPGAGKWIQNAVKHPGAFTAKAKAAGKSVAGFATQVLKPGSKASATTKKQAVLARTLRKINK